MWSNGGSAGRRQWEARRFGGRRVRAKPAAGELLLSASLRLCCCGVMKPWVRKGGPPRRTLLGTPPSCSPGTPGSCCQAACGQG